jgi:hypothetical protein
MSTKKLSGAKVRRLLLQKLMALGSEIPLPAPCMSRHVSRAGRGLWVAQKTRMTEGPLRTRGDDMSFFVESVLSFKVLTLKKFKELSHWKIAVL